MDDAEINDKDIDKQDEVIVGKGAEPAAYPEPADGFYPEVFRLFEDPDQHTADEETAQHEEQFDTIDQPDPGK
jgi:hypothetical protein